MKRRHVLQAATAAIVLPQFAIAQSYPSKPIRYIVPVAAGASPQRLYVSANGDRSRHGAA